MNRFPFQRPLSRFTGATPTSRRHLLAGQRAQLRQVRQQRPARHRTGSPESTATTRPWPSTPDSPGSPGPTPRPPSRSPSPERAGSPRCSDAPEPPRRRQPVRLHQCASRSKAPGCVGPPVACNSWVWAPASGAAPVGPHPLGEFGQHLGVQRVGLGSVGPRTPRRSPVPAWGLPGSPEDPSEQEPRRRRARTRRWPRSR